MGWMKNETIDGSVNTGVEIPETLWPHDALPGDRYLGSWKYYDLYYRVPGRAYATAPTQAGILIRWGSDQCDIAMEPLGAVNGAPEQILRDRNDWEKLAAMIVAVDRLERE